jgi:hypothetical protein
MHKIIRTVLAAAVVCAVITPLASAVTWNHAGTASATIPNPTWLQDVNRIRYHDVIVDAAGVVYMTAGNNATDGALAILTPDDAQNPTSWTKVDVDMTTAGAKGGVTKLVLAGDGKVYGVQNWLEIAWQYAVPFGGPYIPSRVIQIAPTGAITVIKEYSPVEVDSSTNWTNRISGFTVGGDGHLYWTVGGNSGYYKYHFFWRYNVQLQVVEEAPINTVNNGWSESHRMVDLEYVEDGWFAVVNSGDGLAAADAMSWTENRRGTGTTNGVIQPDWGVGRMNKLAYDRARNKLWYGPRGTSHPTTIMGRWNGDTVDGAPASQPKNIGLFEQTPADAQPGIGPGTCITAPKAMDAWHANGNGDSTQNGGRYWVNALVVNPGDSKAWMSWGSQSSYIYAGAYGPVGFVYTAGADDCGPTGNEGQPHAALNSNASQVVALTFGFDNVYAVTCDLVTGQFNLFWGKNPNPPIAGACCTPAGCIEVIESQCPGEFQGPGVECATVDCACRACHKPFADGDGDGDVDQADFAILQMCVSKGGVVADKPCKCSCYDRDGLNGVDAADITLWIKCASGPGIAADENCETAP